MAHPIDQLDVIIVGAGLSGLTAAQVLAEHGLKALVLDKGRSVGGRLATRRIGKGVADHGAQFFTARTSIFQSYVDRWLVDGVIYQWSKGFSDGIKTVAQFDGHPRYAARGGMNALAKHLAGQMQSSAVSIQTDVKVTKLTPKNKGWQALDEAGTEYKARALLLTPPVPQSLTLLGATTGDLMLSDRAALERIAYAPCIAGLFAVEGGMNLPEPGALQRPDAPISWIGDNQRKGISPDATIITVHANGDFSRALWDMPEEKALAEMRGVLETYLEHGSSIIETHLKRWRYAQPTVLHPERWLLASGLPPLIFAGDAFGEARVEGAALSGLAAGEVLADRLL